ncbi:NB-ARC domain containing protein [Parasponia andersonii]|uniref:NB-ARC domain containing protein n=1 Tax=Parasponia andersonii TaxID=3476 RepID=A0A2P5C3L5_PARAD|nr:NB-ARC domain containing protein [Parasponia andersonii]
MCDPAQLVCGCLQLHQLWYSTYKLAERKLKPICGLKKEIEALNRKLSNDIEPKMADAEKVYLQAILKFLENKTENDDNWKRVNHWIPGFKGVSYDVDDLLDKWNTVNIMSKIEAKVCCLIPSFFCTSLRLRRKIVSDMEALKKDLENFEKRELEFDERLNGEPLESLRRATSSFGLPQVHGRDKEKQVLMSKLNLTGGSRTEGGGCVDKTIPIVGMGGVGKTTLAKFVFSDETVRRYFVRIWVSVPYKFDLRKILRTIIEQVSFRGPPSDAAKQTLLNHVVQSISKRKLLLILDDVWDVEKSEWDTLIEAFGNSDPSSKILVTTQNADVVEMMGARNSMIHLDLLSGDDCWKIVSHLASQADWNIGGQLDQHLRDNFWRKCSGLPLVAHNLEFLLRFYKNKKDHWNKDLRSAVSDDYKIFFGTFFLNYYGLSSFQRRCFSYCSVFPRDHQIENDDVVELWMSQDYFVEGSGQRPKEVGQRCFEILANRFLFQDSTKDCNGDIIKCKMHGLVYEFAQFLTEHEEARHFTLSLETSQAQIPCSVKEKKKLRTLFVVRSDTSSAPTDPLSCDLLVKLKCLRTLNLGHCNIEHLPEKLYKLVHLRYLNLSGNPLTTLPNALCYLFNLQTLRLKGCIRLERLPGEIGKLALKFRHLYIEGCDRLKALPKEIGSLSHLQTLDMFIIPSSDDPPNYEALKLEDLRQLDHIRGSIHICRCRNLTNANDLIQATNLVLNDRKNSHVNVKLNFEEICNSTTTVDEQAILGALKPHSDLTSLEIRGCIGTSFPNWMGSLPILKRLVLCGCRNWESLPPLGRLQSLESLRIDNMDGVVTVDSQFFGLASGNDRGAISFPKLIELKFSYLARWRKWEWTTSPGDENGSTIMPRLASLQVSGCGSLEALPGFLSGISNLIYLTIDGCTILTKRCQEGVGDWDKICRIPNIKIDGVPIRPRLVAESRASCYSSALQASTSGNSATPGSMSGPSTVVNSSNTCWIVPYAVVLTVVAELLRLDLVNAALLCILRRADF